MYRVHAYKYSYGSEDCFLLGGNRFMKWRIKIETKCDVLLNRVERKIMTTACASNNGSEADSDEESDGLDGGEESTRKPGVENSD